MIDLFQFELNEGQAENLKDEFRTKTNKIHSMKYQVHIFLFLNNILPLRKFLFQL